MLDRDLQHPVITAMEATGHPTYKDPVYPRCPRCGQECETVYFDNITHTYDGCDRCKTDYDAWDVPECFPSEEDGFPRLA